MCVVAITLFAVADGGDKVPEPDWDKVCFMITNRCMRARHPEDAWMAIAVAKIRYKMSSDQMLEAFKRCIGGLGDSPRERMACARIVHCMNDNCGTNAMPYVEYLIENDRRESTAYGAYRQLVKMEPNLDRLLLFAEKMLDQAFSVATNSMAVAPVSGFEMTTNIWVALFGPEIPAQVSLRDAFAVNAADALLSQDRNADLSSLTNGLTGTAMQKIEELISK